MYLVSLKMCFVLVSRFRSTLRTSLAEKKKDWLYA